MQTFISEQTLHNGVYLLGMIKGTGEVNEAKKSPLK